MKLVFKMFLQRLAYLLLLNAILITLVIAGLEENAESVVKILIVLANLFFLLFLPITFIKIKRNLKLPFKEGWVAFQNDAMITTDAPAVSQLAKIKFGEKMTNETDYNLLVNISVSSVNFPELVGTTLCKIYFDGVKPKLISNDNVVLALVAEVVETKN